MTAPIVQARPPIRPRYDVSGRLDPSFIETAGLASTVEWLADRLAGNDPYLPIDRHADEDPEALIAGLVQEHGTGHPAVALLGNAVDRLLDRLREEPEAPYREALLSLLRRARIPQTQGWFLKELMRLAGAPEMVERRWGSHEGARQILRAATMQLSALPGSVAEKRWLPLLSEPEYATLALVALGTSVERQLSYLPTWWRACPADRADREVEAVVRRVYRSLPPEEAKRLVMKQWAATPQSGLRRAIVEALRGMGALDERDAPKPPRAAEPAEKAVEMAADEAPAEASRYSEHL